MADISGQLSRQGFTIPLTVNHSAAAIGVGLALPDNQVIFAWPPKWLEQRLLAQGKTVGIDLPLKFHVFEQEGEIRLSTNTASYLFNRHALPIKDTTYWIVNKVVEQFGTDTKQNGLVTVEGKRSVDETVEALKAAILANPDARLPLMVDYGASKDKDYGKGTRAVLIVFGNAKVGTPLMQADPRIGIDLPLKFLVLGTKTETQIVYNDPHFLAKRIDLQGED